MNHSTIRSLRCWREAAKFGRKGLERQKEIQKNEGGIFEVKSRKYFKKKQICLISNNYSIKNTSINILISISQLIYNKGFFFFWWTIIPEIEFWGKSYVGLKHWQVLYNWYQKEGGITQNYISISSIRECTKRNIHLAREAFQ